MENSIAIKEMTLINFKGLRNQKVKFHQITDISGDNGTGKTTIFDAFMFLLFGKDSTDRKDFEIKTLDKNNNVIPKIDHEVSAIIVVSGEEIEIKRTLREKWVKKRGSLEAEFSGNETLYFWNDVPLSQREYQEKIAAILDETVFKLITNPGAFNNLKWTDRRNVLIEIVGNVSDEEIAKGNAEFEALLSQLSNKTLDEYKKQIAAQRKKINDELKTIPTRIDEVTRNKPEALDFDKLRTERLALGISLDKIQDQIDDKTKAFDEVLKKRGAISEEIFNIKNDIQNIEFQVKTSVSNSLKTGPSKLDELEESLLTKRGKLNSYNNGLKTLETERDALQAKLNGLSKSITEKRTEWENENGKELNFNDEHFACPTCNRDFEAADIETKKDELKSNFNTKKSEKLTEINTSGKALAIQKGAVQIELDDIIKRVQNSVDPIDELSKEISDLTTEIDELYKVPTQEIESPDQLIKSQLLADPDYQKLKNELAIKEKSLKAEVTVNTDELKASKKTINDQIDAINKDLAVETQITTADKRIAELEAQEGKLAQEMADKEKEQFVIDNFIKSKIDILEGRINSKFNFVKFKLFETQINGAEVECCHTLIDGVPYTDANTASQINAGVDIINTLCEYYQINAPVFVDHAESINQIIPLKSQLIRLVVTNDKKLKIEDGMVEELNGVMFNS